MVNKHKSEMLSEKREEERNALMKYNDAKGMN